MVRPIGAKEIDSLLNPLRIGLFGGAGWVILDAERILTEIEEGVLTFPNSEVAAFIRDIGTGGDLFARFDDLQNEAKRALASLEG